MRTPALLGGATAPARRSYSRDRPAALGPRQFVQPCLTRASYAGNHAPRRGRSLKYADFASVAGVVGREAARALQRNKLRSLLSVLGIAVGIAAVICVMAIGAAGSAQLQQQLHNLGDNMVWVEAGAARVAGVSRGAQSTKTLVAADADALLRQVPLFTRI